MTSELRVVRCRDLVYRAELDWRNNNVDATRKAIAVEQLVASIKENGILHPIDVDDRLVVFSGFLRWSAANALFLIDVPVRIHYGIDIDRFTRGGSVGSISSFNFVSGLRS